MVHLYPQVTKSSDLFDVESAFKGATGNQEECKKEPVENGGTDRREKANGGNDKKTDDCIRKCIKIFGYLIPFILLLSIGAYQGNNYERKIHELTEANRICHAAKTEQEDRFIRVLADYDQRSIDYANEMEDYHEEKMRNERGKTEEGKLELKDANDKIDNEREQTSYVETVPESRSQTGTRTVHISNKEADGKYGFSYWHTTIVSVKPGSPADLNGVKEGDVIVSIDGVKVETGEDVARLGWKETGITLELVQKPATRFVTMGRRDVGMWQSIYGFYHSGTTITGVVPGSSMDRNGVKKGDEIVTIDGDFVRTHDDVVRAIYDKNQATFKIRPYS
ncbi:hypothetical protein PENTCL1PPCAC_10558 [Pristionchus entomophagus]|uniref:PDZ domain-containing protein n=1 Tax=Pristionchus entomophagus TaxID=358040 RepID=A0AAV5SZ85_9BILA|nr:hypothetical protein PENTCL1PPCAC_10558 [Pristionchus entomophagus]